MHLQILVEQAVLEVEAQEVLVLQTERLAQPILEAEAAELEAVQVVVKAVQGLSLFLILAHSVVQAEQLLHLAVTQFTHLHLVAHTRLNHAKHNQCYSRHNNGRT
jgi:hypothetical protein